MQTRFGMIQVYTGDGKGKTTASLGLAMRAAGHGFKTLMLQFLKGDPEYGEVKIAAALPALTIRQTGRNCLVNFANPDRLDRQMAADGWEQAKAAIVSKEYSVVILDEFNLVLGAKLLSTEEVVDFLKKNRGAGVEIVLTGRMAPEEIIALADLVTDMKLVQHYFLRGISSRDGIDH